MGKPTFRYRLARTVSGLCLGLLFVAGMVLFWGVKFVLETSRDQMLLAIAHSELASALDGPGGRVHIHEETPLTLDLTASTSGYEKYAVIYEASGIVIARTTNVSRGSPLPINYRMWNRALRGHVTFGIVPYKHGTLRAIYYPFRDQHGSYHLGVCALPEAPLHRSLRSFAMLLFLTVGISGVLAVVIAIHMARSLTLPLEHIARQAHTIGEQNLSDRLTSVSPDVELNAVSEAFNGMLVRLEKAFTTQQQFLQDASHELRTPLSNLKGTLEVTLRRERTNAEYLETIRVALAETDRLSCLAANLLLLSRADVGQLTLQRASLDLFDVAQVAVQAIQSRAWERGLILCCEGEITLLQGDKIRLRQVFDNLLDNTLRHATAGTTVWVRVWSDTQGAHASVHNTGESLSPNDCVRLFDRFYRVDPGRTRDTGGAGLGLSIVKAIIEAHGGSVGVESDGSGETRFSIVLPR